MSLLKNFITKLTSYSPLKQGLILTLFGLLASLAFAPLYILPAFILGIILLLFTLDGVSSRYQAFMVGWWFGLGHFLGSIYWIGFALTVEGSPFAWMVPFALIGISAVLAVFTGLVCFVTRLLPCPAVPRIGLFTAFWTFFEIARAYVLTGFPWNLSGYALGFSDALIQLASITGVYGLSFALIAFSGCIYLWLHTPKRIYLISALIIPSLLLGFGGYRLSTHPTVLLEEYPVRLVQGNIAQSMKWDEGSAFDHLERYVKLSKRPGITDHTTLIWPETAIPFFLNQDKALISVLSDVVTPKEGALLLGSLRGILDEHGFVRQLWNSLYVLTEEERVFSIYDKTHLVPFGEYVPLGSILTLEKITHGMVDFTKGEGFTTIDPPKFPPFSPLICYEAIFPGEATDGSLRASAMINVVNDGWYGHSTAPYQHLAIARMRSVEEGIPLLRAANTGISAIVDSYGRIIGRTPFEEATVLDGFLPEAIEGRTLFAIYRLWIIGGLLGLVVVSGLLFSFRKT